MRCPLYHIISGILSPQKQVRITNMRNRSNKTRYLGHVTGYQPVEDQYFMIRSVPDAYHGYINPCYEIKFLEYELRLKKMKNMTNRFIYSIRIFQEVQGRQSLRRDPPGSGPHLLMSRSIDRERHTERHLYTIV
eukprot:sb/3474796/